MWDMVDPVWTDPMSGEATKPERATVNEPAPLEPMLRKRA